MHTHQWRLVRIALSNSEEDVLKPASFSYQTIGQRYHWFWRHSWTGKGKGLFPGFEQAGWDWLSLHFNNTDNVLHNVVTVLMCTTMLWVGLGLETISLRIPSEFHSWAYHLTASTCDWITKEGKIEIQIWGWNCGENSNLPPFLCYFLLGVSLYCWFLSSLLTKFYIYSCLMV